MGAKKGDTRRKGIPNKSTSEIKELVRSTVDFPKLILALQKRALKSNDKAAQILFEYGFGKAPQPLTGDPKNPLKFVLEVKNI